MRLLASTESLASFSTVRIRFFVSRNLIRSSLLTWPSWAATVKASMLTFSAPYSTPIWWASCALGVSYVVLPKFLHPPISRTMSTGSKANVIAATTADHWIKRRFMTALSMGFKAPARRSEPGREGRKQTSPEPVGAEDGRAVATACSLCVGVGVTIQRAPLSTPSPQQRMITAARAPVYSRVR